MAKRLKLSRNVSLIALALAITAVVAVRVMGDQGSVTLTTIMPGQDTLRVKRGAVGVNYRDTNTYPDSAIGDDNLIIEGKVGIGTDSPNGALEINSTDNVFLPPRMTGTQRDNIPNPPKGSIIYNTSSGSEEGLNHYDGSNWQLIGGGVTMPVGSIIAWHKSFSGTPSLPSGWVECNGQTLNDSDSPYDGQTIPDLNGERRFLRGNSTSGTKQDDAFQGHRHSILRAYGGSWAGGMKLEYTYAVDNVGYDGGFMVATPITDGTNGTPRIANETRPKNMSIVWIMRVK